jgi:AraC-like DNA-binding protein
MQHFRLSTEAVAERDCFAYWREQVVEGMIGVTGERSRDQSAPFRASLTAAVGPSLARFRYCSDGFPVFRGKREIARHGWDDYVWLYREMAEAGSRSLIEGSEYVTHRGDLVLVDPRLGFAGRSGGGFDHEIWLLPRRLIEPHLRSAQQPRVLELCAAAPFTGLVTAYLGALGSQLDALPDAELELIVENFCRLLAIGCGAAAGEHREAKAAARLAQAQRHIALHLSDPDLTPETAAGALGISSRRLHRLFEPTGSSFSRYVLERRLQECRAALTDPTSSARSVTEIAFAWGFNSLPTFYRNFARAFGVAPGDLRATALRRSARNETRSFGG